MTPGLNITFKMRDWFFNTGTVAAAVDRATRGALSRAGSLVMTIARRSMRTTKNRQQHSPPGHPPRAHSDHPFVKQFLYFALGHERNDVVIGPESLYRHRRMAAPVPSILEFGGRSYSYRRKREVTIAARPFMGPALEKAEPYLERFWHRSVNAA